MMSICEGNTEKEKWDTSINIPIMDCERLGTYTSKQKENSMSYIFIHETQILPTIKTK